MLLEFENIMILICFKIRENMFNLLLELTVKKRRLVRIETVLVGLEHEMELLFQLLKVGVLLLWTADGFGFEGGEDERLDFLFKVLNINSLTDSGLQF